MDYRLIIHVLDIMQAEKTIVYVFNQNNLKIEINDLFKFCIYERFVM